jgi:Glu-tRNA(Gln) amidotransferase subunit E-like FAD-binding protein
MMPSNPAELKKIDTALQQISDSKTRIEAEQEHIKEVVQVIHDEYGLEKKLIRQLAKVWHMRNYAEEVTQQEDFQEAYEALTSVNKKLETL